MVPPYHTKKLVIKKNEIEATKLATTTRPKVTLFKKNNPKIVISVNEMYVGREGLPMKASLNSIATTGIMNARNLRLKCAAPNNAMAPIGVKLNGCGRTRESAAKNISTATVLNLVKSEFMTEVKISLNNFTF